MPNSFTKSSSVVCSMVSKIGLRITLASIIFMGLVQTASVSVLAAAGYDRFIPDRGEPSIKPPPGFRVVGPPMLNKPMEPRHAPLDPRAMHRAGAQAVGVSPNIAISRSRLGAIASVPKRAVVSAVNVSSPNVTGINHWWTYEEDAIPGGGRYMVNVGTGNLLVQYDDMDVSNKGIDLAFRRTYNSGSTHDYANTDGSTPSNYGDGWTNTFDAHVASNSAGGLTIYDIDGARYDYSSNGSGGWIPPAGQYASLTWDGGNGYFWTKKTGTVYYFYGPNQPAASAGFSGRLYEIIGRNNNNLIKFAYLFDNPNLPTALNLNRITATTEAGQAATLQFVDWSYGTAKFRLLGTLTWPDQTVVTYHYRAGTELAAVDEPSNNSAGTLRSQSFGWSANHIIYNASSPIYTASSGANGGYIGFALSSGRVTQVSYHAVVNPAIADGTNSGVLQAGIATGMQQYKTVTYTTNLNSAETSVGDSDGHRIDYFWDPQARVKYVHAWSSTTAFLTSYNVWDSQNNLIATLDPRSSSVTDTTYRTDYAYDNDGNTTQVMQPTLSTSSGSFRPTFRYSYDSNDNLIAYCDAIFTHNNSTCSAALGATQYAWSTAKSTPNEPLGELLTVTTPLGYQHHFAYDPAAQGGSDDGLPTSITGDPMKQVDLSIVTPHQSFTYDGYGNLATYDKGSGNWTLTYDGSNRLTVAMDPDGVASYKRYFPNGEVSTAETASQHASGSGVTFSYDADNNESQELHHFANEAGATQKWYDGMDRLLEVSLPSDSDIDDGKLNITRYWYDLSKNAGALSVGSSSAFSAHGNLYKTQECYFDPSSSSCTWQDLRGTAYDALDRAIAQYNYAPGNATIQATQLQYDNDAQSRGQLSYSIDPLAQKTSYSYDAVGKQTAVQFSGDGGVTPNRSYSYDANGKTVSVNSSVFGAYSYGYDAEGRMVNAQEPSGTGLSAPATLTYDYYLNGWRKAVRVTAAPAFPSQTALFQYSYRADGRRTQLQYSGATKPFLWSYTKAGREQSQSDPYTGQQTPSGLTYGSRSISYDAYGRISTLQLPQAAKYTNLTYDKEDEVTGHGLTPPNFDPSPDPNNPTTAQLSYNVRGEASGQSYKTYASSTAIGSYQLSVLGHMCSPGTVDPFVANCGVDQRTSALLRVSGPLVCSDSFGNHSNSTSYAYDLAGRQTSSTHVIWNKLCSSSQVTETRSYDAENHLLTHVPSRHYGWGPNGHPVVYDGKTLHWDGNTLLYITDASGNLLDVKIETLADVYSLPDRSGLEVSDRDFSGLETGTHSSAGFTDWVPARHYFQPGDAFNDAVSVNPVFSGGVPGVLTSDTTATLHARRTDGYSDDAVTIQGVRAYDPGMQQWTTPDAYQGVLHDPMSQKPYMWNRNNPILYSDPSGYCPWCEPVAEEWEQLQPELQPAEAEGIAALRASQSAISQAASRAADWLKQAGASVDQELQAVATRLFKAGEQEVRGGTAGAIRKELLTGEAVRGRFHLQKGAQEINTLKDLISRGGLNAQEMQKAKTMLQDLQNAYGKLNPQQFINNNNLPIKAQ